MANISLITGGVKSGKSRFASQLLLKQSDKPLLIATARRTDAEMSARIDHHIKERDERWRTIEEPLSLGNALLENRDQAVLIDCLGVWLTNLMVETPDSIKQELSNLNRALDQRTQPTVFVSNETGLGVIGADAMTREFVDHLGLLNQAIAERASQVYFCVAGQPLTIKDNSTKPSKN